MNDTQNDHDMNVARCQVIINEGGIPLLITVINAAVELEYGNGNDLVGLIIDSEIKRQGINSLLKRVVEVARNGNDSYDTELDKMIKALESVIRDKNQF
jgi:hypothetical protein